MGDHMVEVNEIKIFLDEYQAYNEIRLVEEKDEIEQAIYFGHIRCIEATRNLIQYLEEQD